MNTKTFNDTIKELQKGYGESRRGENRVTSLRFYEYADLYFKWSRT